MAVLAHRRSAALVVSLVFVPGITSTRGNAMPHPHCNGPRNHHAGAVCAHFVYPGSMFLAFSTTLLGVAHHVGCLLRLRYLFHQHPTPLAGSTRTLLLVRLVHRVFCLIKTGLHASVR